MKRRIYFAIITLLIFCPFIFTQSIGLSAGYGFLNMDKVNAEMEDSYNIITSAGIYAMEPEKISGGLFLEGNFKYTINNFNLGIEGDYISSTGNFRFNDYAVSFAENYDVKTIEIFGLIEILLPTDNPVIEPFIQAAGGIGIASADFTGSLIDFTNSDNNSNIKSNLDGNYFAGRFKGGMHFIIQKIVLELAIGYRMSNAGELKGDHVINGIRYKNLPLYDINNNGIEFNYSGFLITGGISIHI